MPNQNPMYMAPEAIVQEIDNLRDVMDSTSRRIYELSRVLHQRMRRIALRQDAEGSNAGVYVTYSNAWSRFAGVIQQGLNRTRQADRMLGLLTPVQDPVAPEPQPENAPEPAQAYSIPLNSSSHDDFISLYGEESVRHADREPER